jgi:hypothetical protein
VPAAAVIPAPIAYIKVVAVKKLVVELESVLGGVGLGAFFFFLWGEGRAFLACHFFRREERVLSQTGQVSQFSKGFNPCLRSLDALYCCVFASQNSLP